MIGRISHHMTRVLVAAVLGSGACGGPSDAPPNAAAAEAGYFTGRITMRDGSPITLPGVTYKIKIAGVTAVGESNNLYPPISPDGTFRLKLPKGLFYPSSGTITFPFEGKNYLVDFVPVNPVPGTRDGADGIMQNFIWQISGPKPGTLNPDIRNKEDWFGITMSVGFVPYGDDTQQSPTPMTEGTRLVFTFTPSTKLFDGSEAKPVTVERKWSESPSFSIDAINDLPPANYAISGVAILPEGITKTLKLKESYNVFKPTITLTLAPYHSGSGVFMPDLYFVCP